MPCRAAQAMKVPLMYSGPLSLRRYAIILAFGGHHVQKSCIDVFLLT